MSFAISWNLAILLVTTYILHLIPRLTRPEVVFGVTVRSDFRDSPEGRRLIRIFRQIIWGLASVVTAAMIVVRDQNRSVALAGAVWLFAIGSSIAWYFVHRMTRQHAVPPSAQREAVVSPADVTLPGHWLAKLGPFLILGGAALYLYLNYDALPDPYPVHWNFEGVANRHVAKTLKVVLRPLVMGFVVCGALVFSAYTLAGRSRRIFASGEAAVRESKFRRMILWLMLAAQYHVACIHFWLTTVFRAPDAMPFARYALLVMSILPLPFSVYISLKYGQGGSRLADVPTSTLGIAGVGPAAGASPTQPVGDRTPDSCWKLGQLYYNPEDPAVWVEKRAGVGYTLNFARPLAWVILLTMLLAPFVVMRLMRG